MYVLLKCVPVSSFKFQIQILQFQITHESVRERERARKREEVSERLEGSNDQC